MKGYIYTMYGGADPGIGWEMTDPIFKGIPTMGACRPDIRRKVEQGDYIFAISGKVLSVRQHIVGAFAVDKKIDALTAHALYPQNRLTFDHGKQRGNIIVDGEGKHIEGDYHSNWERRTKNYIVGKDPIYFDKDAEMQRAKEETLQVLNDIFGKNEERVFDILGRFGKKIDEGQVGYILEWMKKIKQKK